MAERDSQTYEPSALEGARVELKSIPFKEAKQFVIDEHRHHKPPVSWKFGTSVVNDEGEVVGIVMVGRPVARGWDHRTTLEVTRLATDGTKNACTMLYSAAARASKALGYDQVITYTLASEPGTSLRAAGWEFVRHIKGRSWDTPSRRRKDKHPTVDKKLWRKVLNERRVRESEEEDADA